MRRPRFIAEQARHAKGPLGRLVAFVMARETFADNQRAIEALAIEESDHVLDVGCGHGRSLGALAALASKGHVAGADPSDLMAEIAVGRNRALVKAKRVDVVIATAADLPFASGAFDKVLCAHVLYFWKDLHAGFREIARVLKPGGRLALLFRSSQHAAAVRAFPADVYTFPDLTEVESALVAAGFTLQARESSERSGQNAASPHLLVATRLASTPRRSMPPI